MSNVDVCAEQIFDHLYSKKTFGEYLPFIVKIYKRTVFEVTIGISFIVNYRNTLDTNEFYFTVPVETFDMVQWGDAYDKKIALEQIARKARGKFLRCIK